jgi:hypothetical protein
MPNRAHPSTALNKPAKVEINNAVYLLQKQKVPVLLQHRHFLFITI